MYEICMPVDLVILLVVGVLGFGGGLYLLRQANLYRDRHHRGGKDEQ
jgi:hypothetical protein